jgi:integrase
MEEKTKWVHQWKNWVAPSRFPNVWKIKQGGYLVRARVTDPTTGIKKEIRKVLPTDELSALNWLETERARIKAGLVSASPPQTRFADYVVSLVERKLKSGDIKSAKGKERWEYTLRHLVGGTNGKESEKYVVGFGEFFIDTIHVSHVERWKADIGEFVLAGDYSPTTANGWLAILRVIMKAAKTELQLKHLATEGVTDFDTSEHVVYSEEEPNSLEPEEVPRFLAALKEMSPQHYAMCFLGFATGLRPSSLRPLRRAGDAPDVLWDKNRVLVRRSQTLGDEVMKTTKQKRRYAIDLPEEVMSVLRWHAETQLTTPEQQASELLFPSVTGGFRSPSVLTKPFDDVAEAIGLGKRFTQSGMRRTFNDLARAAQVASLVTRSISGHQTERMQEHYSTVNAAEQRAGIAKVIDLMSAREARAEAGRGAT